ncbi:MAG: ribonuclease H-like domain-containing protein [Nanobdellota archaeon]
MLQSTFVHIPKVGKRFEERIWTYVRDWEEFLDKYEHLDIPVSKKIHVACYVKKSIEAYREGDMRFFANLLEPALHWRAYPHCRKVGFLDIETTGLSKERDKVTLIGLYDGHETNILINGQNLNQFQQLIQDYDMLITYNGRCFDLPFLKAKFPSTNFNQLHVDLRFVMRSLGYSGGLKMIERSLGLARDDDIAQIDGFEAVRLWHRYQQGDERALDQLVEYNKADITNLKHLMDFAYAKLVTHCRKLQESPSL